MGNQAITARDPAAPGARAPHREFGSALEKALYVLDAVVAEDQPIGLAYLSDALELPKPTIHRVLAQLERSGLVERTPDRNRYHIGPGLNRRACAALGSRNQRRSIRSILAALVAEVGETCNVGVLDEHEVRYLERVECDAPLRVHIGPGHRVPAHCTALGKLLLATLPHVDLERHLEAAPLTRYTDNTIVDRAELEAELERVRGQSLTCRELPS